MDPSKRPKVPSVCKIYIFADDIKWNVSQDMLMATFGEDDVRWIRPFSTFGMVREFFEFAKFLQNFSRSVFCVRFFPRRRRNGKCGSDKKICATDEYKTLFSRRCKNHKQ